MQKHVSSHAQAQMEFSGTVWCNSSTPRTGLCREQGAAGPGCRVGTQVQFDSQQVALARNTTVGPCSVCQPEQGAGTEIPCMGSYFQPPISLGNRELTLARTRQCWYSLCLCWGFCWYIYDTEEIAILIKSLCWLKCRLSQIKRETYEIRFKSVKINVQVEVANFFCN